MSLLGEAAMVFWHDITDGDDDYFVFVIRDRYHSL